MYAIEEEILAKGSMHQIKNVKSVECRNQFNFYLKNVLHMVKTDNMFVQNYSKLNRGKKSIRQQFTQRTCKNTPVWQPQMVGPRWCMPTSSYQQRRQGRRRPQGLAMPQKMKCPSLCKKEEKESNKRRTLQSKGNCTPNRGFSLKSCISNYNIHEEVF